MRRGAVADGDAGFLLPEALLALVLWALIFTTMLFAGKMVARHAAEASRAGGDVEALDLGLEALRRDVQAALPVLVGGRETSRILFDGSDSAVTFVVGADGVGGHLDERVVTLRAEAGILTRRFRALSPGEAWPLTPASGEPSTLIAGPWRFRFSYSGERAGRGQEVGRWPGEGGLPRSIHLDISTADGLLVLSAALARIDGVFRGEEQEAERAGLAAPEPFDG